MRRYLPLPLLFTFILPIQADDTCLFISQYEPDLTIEVSTKDTTATKGYMNYKGSPVFRFSTGIRTEYRGQYFSFDNIPKLLSEKEAKIVSGSVITIIGDQSGTGTPIRERKQGLTKVFFPNLGLNYYYFLADGHGVDEGLQDMTKKVNSILSAAEGFWIPSEICKKYVLYGW